MKPFKQGVKSWPKVQITARLIVHDETKMGEVYRTYWKHQKTSELPIQPTLSNEIEMPSIPKSGCAQLS